MRICFFRSDKPREGLLADAFARGVIEHGDDCVVRPLTGEAQIAEDCEVAVMVGVKSRELFQANWNAGVHTLMVDKGYVRHSGPGPAHVWEYWRVAVDAHHPTRYLMNKRLPHDRLEKLNLKLRPWRKHGEHVVIAGSSEKYHNFYNLPHPTAYTHKLIKAINHNSSNREIIYRPKPSWKDAQPVKGSRISTGKETLSDVLERAHCLITHGSNACFEAVLWGIPCIVLGDAVAKPISSTDIEGIEEIKMVSDKERVQWLANLAWQQWKLPEFASGEAWNYIRPLIYG